MLKKFKIFIFIPLVLLAACFKRPISITSSCFRDRESGSFKEGSSFVVSSVKKENSVLSRDLEDRVKDSLMSKGYVIKNSQEADYSVVLDYGMASSRGTKKAIKYLPGDTVYGIKQTYGSSGFSCTEEVYETPSKLVLAPENCTYYTKFLSLSVYDNGILKRTGDESRAKIWYANATNVDEHPDLRNYINCLLEELMDRLGYNGDRERYYFL